MVKIKAQELGPGVCHKTEAGKVEVDAGICQHEEVD